ncbi:MAG TPA: cytochrome P450 [Gammaproteobacteria bacterium]|nr:cytochrome P450 [Gammaproteobacteria bacterium]
MVDNLKIDWDPAAATVLENQTAAFDDMRDRCPVAHGERLPWSVFRHSDVMRVLRDPEAFSNRVSAHLSVPNGMDPPEHTRYRRAIEPFLDERRVAAFEPEARAICDELGTRLPGTGAVEIIERYAQPFAARSQCAFLGWPQAMERDLVTWVRSNHEATVAGDRPRQAALAREFEDRVGEQLDLRRATRAAGAADITTELMVAPVDGEPMRDEELISLLRNWTVGEIGTITAAVGIIARELAGNAVLQQRLRDEPDLIPRAVEEILRIEGPLATNRRRATRPVRLGNRDIAVGEQVTVMWVSANRDETVFHDATTIDLDRDQSDNLLYGAGIHVCPGAALARMELQTATSALLEHTDWIEPDPDDPAVRAVLPASGFSRVPVRVR